MSTLPNADAARAAAATGPDLPASLVRKPAVAALLARRETGAEPARQPMTFGPAVSTSPARIEPTIRPMPGVSLSRKVYGMLAMLLPPGVFQLGKARNNSAGAFDLKSGGSVSLMFADGFWAISFRRPLPEMGGPDFVDSYSLTVDHEAHSVAVVTRSLDLVGNMEADQADNLSALMGELAAALDRGAAGKIKLAPVVTPPAATVQPLPAMARALEAFDTGADQMPAALDSMTAPEQRAALAPYLPPAMVVTISAEQLEGLPAAHALAAATDAAVLEKLAPSSVIPMRSTAGRAFPRQIDRVPPAALLPPAPKPQERTAEDIEAEALALVEGAQAVALRERGISAPLEAFEVEEDAETGALVCRPDEDHPCWKPRAAAPRRALAPSRPAPAPVVQQAAAPVLAAPVKAPRNRKGKAAGASAPVVPAPKASKKPQGIDFDAFIGRALENALTAAANKIAATVDQKVSEALARALGN